MNMYLLIRKMKNKRKEYCVGHMLERSASKMKIVDHVLDLAQKAVGE